MTTPRYGDLEEAQREWRTGEPVAAVGRVVRVIRRSDDLDRRLEAIKVLGEFGAAARAGHHDIPWVADPEAETHALVDVAVPALIEGLSDCDDRVRFRACAALGRLAFLATEAIPHLHRLAQDSNRRLQAKASSVLRQIQLDHAPSEAG